MNKIVVFTGAGISAESGLKTFRDSGGLWEGHRVEEVATPEAFRRNPELVLEFYNQRRRQLLQAEPNAAHLAIARLQEHFQVVVVTQNVDDLHERAGSGHIIHLHGELRSSRSTANPELRYRIEGPELNLGDLCELGSQLRPDIVWFGEEVPRMTDAIAEVMDCDLLLVVGTSLEVYPAAGLLNFVPDHAGILIVDPNRHAEKSNERYFVISETAVNGVPPLAEQLIRRNHS